MSVPHSHIYKLCGRKRQYSSKKNAEQFLRSIRKRGIIVSPNADVYKCPFGNHWHTGHKRENEIR